MSEPVVPYWLAAFVMLPVGVWVVVRLTVFWGRPSRFRVPGSPSRALYIGVGIVFILGGLANMLLALDLIQPIGSGS